MSEHVPTTDQIREAYLDGNGGTHPRAFEPGWGRDRAGDRFDRWLAQYEADLRERIANDLLIERDRARSAHQSAQVDHFAHDYCRWVGHAEALTQAANRIARGKDQS